VPIVVVDDPESADVVLTVKNYYRRKPQPLRDAEASGTPIHVLRTNSIPQIEEALVRLARAEMRSATSIALQETEEAIADVLNTARAVELSPQNAYIRRLQHQLAERYNLASQSTGREPYRRVRIFMPER